MPFPSAAEKNPLEVLSTGGVTAHAEPVSETASVPFDKGISR